MTTPAIMRRLDRLIDTLTDALERCPVPAAGLPPPCDPAANFGSREIAMICRSAEINAEADRLARIEFEMECY